MALRQPISRHYSIKTAYFRLHRHCTFSNLLGFSIRYCLRMRMVEFCQESTSLLTAAVSCLLLASCSFRVSNSCRLVASCFFRILNSCWLTHCHDACGEIWYIISEPDWGYLCSSPFCAVAATRDDVSTAARIISSCILLCFTLKLSPSIFATAN